MILILFFIYSAASLGLLMYSAYCLYLVLAFRQIQRRERKRQADILNSVENNSTGWPVVTTQLPLYNEADVAERVIRAAAAMRYPEGQHEIQVLDDSTDDSQALIDNVVEELRSKGVDIQVLRRKDRTGFKAGALAEGLRQACGDMIAVFDADFVPPKDFLKKTVTLAQSDTKIACVQGRWEHLNREENLLTLVQSLGIDSHFTLEQSVRSWSGFFLNFNGTAGLWRRQAIEEAGGWSADTLTEDLDLSYRAQLKGWRIEYCMDIHCPAEIPNTIYALKTQQQRWAQGSIQTARKLLGPLWASALPLRIKLFGSIHLTAYSISLFMLILPILAMPLIVHLRGNHDWLQNPWGSLFLFSAIPPSLMYASAGRVLNRKNVWLLVPGLLLLGFGICLNNALAVVRGLFGGKHAPFLRTPKSGSTSKCARSSQYGNIKSSMWVYELLLGSYCLLSFLMVNNLVYWLAGLFILLHALGFLGIALWPSLERLRKQPKMETQGEFCISEAPAAAEQFGIEHS